jgi:hypothetical protein
MLVYIFVLLPKDDDEPTTLDAILMLILAIAAVVAVICNTAWIIMHT